MTGEDNRLMTSEGSINDAASFQQVTAPAPAFTQLGVPPGLPVQTTNQNVTHAHLGVPPGVSTHSAFQTAVPFQRFPPNTATQSTGPPPIFGQHLAPNIPAQNTDHSYAMNPFLPSAPDGPLKVEQNPSPRPPIPMGALTRQALAPIPVPGLFQRSSTQPTSFQDLSAQSAACASVVQAPKAPMSGHPPSARHPAATVTRQPLTPRPGAGSCASRQPLAPIIAPGLFQQSGSSSAPAAPGGLREFAPTGASITPAPVVAGTTTQPGRITGALGAQTTTPASTATTTPTPAAPTPGTTATPTLAAPTPTPAASPTPGTTATPLPAATIPTAALSAPTPAAPIPTAALAAPTPVAPTHATATTLVFTAPTPGATTIPPPTAPASTGCPTETILQPVLAPNVAPASGGSNQQIETTAVQQRLPPSNMLAWRSKGIIGLISNHSIWRSSTF